MPEASKGGVSPSRLPLIPFTRSYYYTIKLPVTSADGAPRTMSTVSFWPLCPRADNVTEHDRRHVKTYIRLMEADTAGASEDEMAREIVPGDRPTKARIARIAVRSHLRRAYWLLEHGFFPLVYWADD